MGDARKRDIGESFEPVTASMSSLVLAEGTGADVREVREPGVGPNALVPIFGAWTRLLTVALHPSAAALVVLLWGKHDLLQATALAEELQGDHLARHDEAHGDLVDSAVQVLGYLARNHSPIISRPDRGCRWASDRPLSSFRDTALS